MSRIVGSMSLRTTGRPRTIAAWDPPPRRTGQFASRFSRTPESRGWTCPGRWSCSRGRRGCSATMAGRVRRIGSVCTGAFLLAESGLLDGRTATTHWSRAAELQRRYPKVRVEEDRIWVRDGDVYTSAGVSAGMDLALALIEEDLGADVALAVARAMVMYLRRPGDQSQYSAPLRLQAAQTPSVRELIAW